MPLLVVEVTINKFRIRQHLRTRGEEENPRQGSTARRRLYLGDCGSKRASSASVETVYSGATKLSDSADRLSDAVLASYVFIHYNWKYDFLRPIFDEIVAKYKRTYSSNPPADEVEEAGEGEAEAEEVESEAD